MDFDNEQIDLAVAEIGSAILRLQRAGLTEAHARKLVQRVTEMDELPDSCDEKMWNEAGPKGDESAPAVKEAAEDAPDTKRDTKKGDDEEEDAADTVRDPVQKEGWDRFMDQILLGEGRRANARATDLPDSPGMQYAKRYGEKAHNRIVVRK